MQNINNQFKNRVEVTNMELSSNTENQESIRQSQVRLLRVRRELGKQAEQGLFIRLNRSNF